MRLAQLVLVHDRPSQVERLLKRLICPDTDIYIHLDKKCPIADYIHLQSLQNVFFIKNRTDITWANYSMVAATLICFEEILDKQSNYSHINLLSGHDYPLKDASAIREFLFANPDKTFMAYRNIRTEWPETLTRFTRYSFGDYNFPFKFALQVFLDRFLPGKKLPLKLQPYGRSQWFTITPECARFVIEYLKKHASVRRFFRMTWGVDELVFQTVLMNSILKDKVVNNHLRFIKFIKGASSPLILTMDDSQDLISSGKFYARKFNPDIDNEILDFLDETAQLQTSRIPKQ